MRALVTGGTGFIGAYLVQELLDNHYKVKVLSRHPQDDMLPEVEVVKGDLLQPETLAYAVQDVDMVFHNAAYAADRYPSLYLRNGLNACCGGPDPQGCESRSGSGISPCGPCHKYRFLVSPCGLTW